MLKANPYYLGIDAGIASCGIGAVNSENDKVIFATSCIFPAAEASKNKGRRDNRGARRVSRRRKVRVKDFEKLWEKYGYPMPSEGDINLVNTRVKALSEKISLPELFNVLKYELRHRGISYLDDLDEEVKKSGDYSRGLQLNQLEMQDKFPCQIQAERIEKYNAYRGQHTTEINGEKIVVSNVFTTSAYKKECLAILEAQKGFNSEITDEFIEEYLKIFSRKRLYYIGPGNELSRTDYGVYTTNRDADGNYITDKNIFDKLIGKCSVYPDEFRAAGASYTAQEFNFLNDMNNLTVGGRKLEEDEKRQIQEAIFNAKTVNVEKIITKITGVAADDIKGARIDKEGKHLYHTFEAYRKMVRFFAENGKDLSNIGKDTLDKIAHALTLNTEHDGITEGLKEAELALDDDVIELFIAFRKSNSTLFSKWQSLSIKVMKDLIPTMWEEPVEQMTLLSGLGLLKSKKETFKGLKYIPASAVTEEIYNPVVRRSVRIAIKAINETIRQYGYPEQIVIEMPRDKNSEDERKRIENNQKLNEKELDKTIERIKNECGIEIKDYHFKNQKQLTLKLKLWNEQGGICPYSGKRIDIATLISTPSMFEIDHIIPLSISLDDSRANKVLVYRSENQDKGNKTPYQYLTSLSRDWGWPEYKAKVLEMKAQKHIVDGKTPNIGNKKVSNLLFTEDITKQDVIQGFISRNLNDTRYASRVILNTLQAFFDANEIGTKVKVIRGAFTSAMRSNFKLEKNREESYAHHAVDACLIAYSQMRYDAYKKMQGGFIDFETGEILDQRIYDEKMTDEVYEDIMYGQRWAAIRAGLNEAELKVKYWHRVDKKPNRQLSDATIYGTREFDGKTIKIAKTPDIRTQKGYEAFIKHKDKNELLCQRYDIKTYEKLLAICEQYKDAKNPFVKYEKDGNIVTKYAKKNNGPKITCLKYESGEVGSCIDISHKYGFKNGSKKVVLCQLSPFRTDVYKNIKTGQYYLIGLKYSDIKSVKGGYSVDEKAYVEILRGDKKLSKILSVGETRADLPKHDIEYQFSLYENDIIRYEKDGKVYTERFLSRTKTERVNYIETKPIDKDKFGKQNQFSLAESTKIEKLFTDILGNYHACQGEKWQEIF